MPVTPPPRGERGLAVLPATPLDLHAGPAKGRSIAETVIKSFPSCPIPEVARLGRTLKAWKTQVLAYFDTNGVSNGGTEAICECGGGWSGTGLVRMVLVVLPVRDPRSNWPAAAVSFR